MRLPQRATAGQPPFRRESALALVEIMVATTIFAFVAMTLVGLFLQNQRLSTFLGYRAQAVTTSLSILEQMRFQQYPEVEDIYNADAAGSISVELVDPNNSDGYVDLMIPVNIRDSTRINPDWTEVDVVVDPDSTAPKLPMKFYLCLTKRNATGANPVDLFEIILLYQWATRGASGTDWQTGNVRLVVPNLNPMS